MSEWYHDRPEALTGLVIVAGITAVLLLTRKENGEPTKPRQFNRNGGPGFSLERLFGGGSKPNKPEPEQMQDELFEANYSKIQWAPTELGYKHLPQTVPLEDGPMRHLGDVNYSLTYDNTPYKSQSFPILPDDFIYEYDKGAPLSSSPYDFQVYAQNRNITQEHLPTTG
jgi:hypothetical protein